MAFYCKCEHKNFALRYDVVNIYEGATRASRVLAFGCGSDSADDDDMQPPRTVSAQQKGLLDISGPRGARDEIECARRLAFAVDAPHLGEHALVIRLDRLARQKHDMIVGQEIEGCRVVWAGNERQRAGFRDARKRR